MFRVYVTRDIAKQVRDLFISKADNTFKNAGYNETYDGIGIIERLDHYVSPAFIVRPAIVIPSDQILPFAEALYNLVNRDMPKEVRILLESAKYLNKMVILNANITVPMGDKEETEYALYKVDFNPLNDIAVVNYIPMPLFKSVQSVVIDFEVPRPLSGYLGLGIIDNGDYYIHEIIVPDPVYPIGKKGFMYIHKNILRDGHINVIKFA
ncbi:hypothetical protein SBV1_gp40 [Sulfolobales Beppu virus 1]|nr:hypothetical protein SBV1_gp40 [Sulfolobales Beppu virus 1]